MTDEILKPCPFGCEPKTADGEDAVVLICESDVRAKYDIGFGVRCNHCGTEMWEEYMHEVVERWNRRSPSIPAQDGT